MKSLIFTFSVLFGLSSLVAQNDRYLTEVFSESDIEISANVIYGSNVNYMPASVGGNDPADIGAAVAAILGGASLDTLLNFVDLKMDIYQPKQTVDTLSERPVILYIHTGNFLPPAVNGSPMGSKDDLMAIELCTQMAKRGYVAIAANYRHGWNPLLPSEEDRTKGLLNAVYRAIHDIKQAVRFTKSEATTYNIDKNKIALFGMGSGGYVALAYSTLDDPQELYLDKFVGTDTVPFIDTLLSGPISGIGGLLNAYIANGESDEIHVCVNTGGALADTSWLEQGDVPMIAFQTIRDPFAPFGEGIVKVPTTNGSVVEAFGANIFIDLANSYGNNDVFRDKNISDVYTSAAEVRYGMSYEYFLPAPNDSIHVKENMDGMYPFLFPLAESRFKNQASPWDWWDPTSPASLVEVAPDFTTHMASLLSNPDMSETKCKTYLDTIQNYLQPRLVLSLELPNNIGITEYEMTGLEAFPNPVKNNLNIRSEETIKDIIIYDISGKMVRQLLSIDKKSLNLSRDNIENGVYLIKVIAHNGNSSTLKISWY